MREDDPVFYKVKMERLLRQARKNGVQVDFSIYDGQKEKTVKVLFKAPDTGECAGATVVKRRK